MRNAPYLDFPLDEYQRRLDSIRRFMSDDQIDLLVLTVRENVEYLCGFRTVSWRNTDKSFWLIVPRAGPLRFFADPIHVGNEEQTKLDFMVLLTVQTMNYLNDGHHRVAL